MLNRQTSQAARGLGAKPVALVLLVVLLVGAAASDALAVTGMDFNQQSRARIIKTVLGFSSRNDADAISEAVASRSFTGNHSRAVRPRGSGAFNLSEDRRHAQGLTLWGGGSARAFSSSPDDAGLSNLNGSAFQGFVGTDYHVTQNVYGATIGASRTNLDLDTRDEGAVEARVDILSVSPYATLELESGAEVWGTFGLAQGRMHYSSATISGRRYETTDVRFRMVAGGFTQPLHRIGTGVVSLKMDVYNINATAEARAQVFERTLGVNTRGRMLFEVANRSSGRSNPWSAAVRAGARYELGEGPRGLGFEMNAHMTFKSLASGIAIDATLGGLFLHTDQNYRQLDGSIGVRIDPGVRGKGAELGFYAKPSGGAAGGTVRLQLSWRPDNR